MALTDLQLKQAAPRDKDWKLADSGGLYILIRTNGSKLWRMKYRQDGREKKLTFGRYPEVSLREARLRRDEARVEIGQGGDPARRKREEKIAALIRAGDTFESVSHEFISKREAEGLAMATLVKMNWLAAVFNIDLYFDVVTKATEWPTTDHSIKTLAKYLGFSWRDTDPSGAASIEWYQRWVETGDERIRQRILDYNEDDCRATAVLLDGIRELAT